MRVRWISTGLLVCLLTGLPFWSQASEAKMGGIAPFFFVPTYNPEKSGARRVSLDRLVGTKAEKPRKVLLLSFFNIDCKPCRKELPFLQAMYEKYRDKGLGVVVVNCDYRKEKIAETHKYVTTSGFTFPVLKDRFQALQRRYGVESFPTMFIIDAGARIQDIRVGYNEETLPFPLADIQRRLGVPAEPIRAKPKSISK